ncbi:hypothetical protein [Sporosarcina trichiuri]|uniref:hypothetical protein n=1 Tax=Sporosarcina trichiuri TaxID=3056445 RepID=UPI0025B54DE2|nr:hypothetical protein [Sporosarcina sp. 0.2-SM1T-5]WJY28888.1 hypothetical protein QWT68_07850 [Sporosarcina sp. 0.2-SM1T-5]
MRRRLTNLFSLLAALTLLLGIVPAGRASAAPDLSISVQAGLDNKTKMGEGAQLFITVENKGSLFTGDLILDTASGQSSGVGQAIPVTVGEGEKQTVSMVVDSLEDPQTYTGSPAKKNIFLFENGWRNGKEVAHSGTQMVSSASYPPETLFIAGLGENIDRLSSLKDIQLKGSQGMELLNLSKPDGPPLPDTAAGWEAADIIAADRYPIADLTADQQQAMLDWVNGGGTLLLSGSDNPAAEAGIFREDLPLDLGAAEQLPPAIFGDKFKEPIPGYKAAAAEDAVILLEKDGIILAAAKQLGNGMIVQTSFTFGSDAYRSSIGVKKFWPALLDKRSLLIPQRPVSSYYNSPADDLAWSVGENNEVFPSFKVSTPLLFGFILIYMILIIPLLYVILKRKDRREHAWWIIPAAAVLVSVVIFAYGAKDRLGKSQLQHSAVYEVQPDGRLTGYYVESLLTDKSGDFSFSLQKPSSVFVSSSVDGLFGSGQPAHERAVVEKGPAAETLSFRKLGFWNVATFYGKTEMADTGKFDAQLTVADGRLTGTITNSFPFAMEDVMVLSGTKKIELGTVQAGETLTVRKEVKASVLGPRISGQSGFSIQQPAGQDDLIAMRKEGLLEFSSLHMNNSPKPLLAGTARAQLMDVSLDGRKAESSALSVILQPVDIRSVLSGTVKVDSDLMDMEMVSSTGQSAELLDDMTKDYMFYEKDYTQTWRLPADFLKDVAGWSKLDLLGADMQAYGVSILNTESGEYEPLEGKSTLTVEPADPYVSKEGAVTVKLEISDQRMGEPVHPPELRLTGEAVK